MPKVSKTAKAAPQTPPTMIIPRGTAIEVDPHGQLSVRAPGNLVIQHSGSYGNLESVTGSIRIEPEVDVEAVSVQCAETCYVQGNLTAWKVAARSLQLEDTAQAHIVLQETQKLQVGKGARLVGNFDSESELFYLFSRFARQVRSLPGQREPGDGEEEVVIEEPVPALPGAVEGTEDATAINPLAGIDPSASQELPDALYFSLLLLERDQGKSSEVPRTPESRRALKELMKLLRDRDEDTLQATHRTLFSRIQEPTSATERARELVQGYFGADLGS